MLLYCRICTYFHTSRSLYSISKHKFPLKRCTCTSVSNESTDWDGRTAVTPWIGWWIGREHLCICSDTVQMMQQAVLTVFLNHLAKKTSTLPVYLGKSCKPLDQFVRYSICYWHFHLYVCRTCVTILTLNDCSFCSDAIEKTILFPFTRTPPISINRLPTRKEEKYCTVPCPLLWGRENSVDIVWPHTLIPLINLWI